MARAAAAKNPEPEPQLPMLATEDAWTAALRNAGFLSQSNGGSDFHRLKIQGQNVVYDDEIIASYNAATKEPAMYVRIAGPLTEYQSLWFDKDGALARAIGRPGIAGKMCKSHFDDPNEARRFGVAGNGTGPDGKASCDECPVMPFAPKDSLPEEAKGKRCAWKADVDLYILEKQADGTLVQTDDTLYTMSLSTTGVIEFKGSSSKKSNGTEGSVSPESTYVRMAKLGVEKWGESGLLKAMSYYNLGGLICEFRLLPASANGGQFNYTVPSFHPIDIMEIEEPVALETNEDGTDEEAVPF